MRRWLPLIALPGFALLGTIQCAPSRGWMAAMGLAGAALVGIAVYVVLKLPMPTGPGEKERSDSDEP